MQFFRARALTIGCAVWLMLSVRGKAIAETPICSNDLSHIVMESGTYSSQPGVTFVLRHFDATLVPLGKAAPACLEKMTDVSHASIFVSNESLTQVFTSKLEAANSKIRNLQIQHDFGMVTLTGEMVKLVPIKFLISGPVSTDGTRLLMHADKINAEGIPIKMLLSMVGEHLSSVLGLKDVQGVQVDGNVMSFKPEAIAHLRGYIASVDATPQGLTLHYARRPGSHTHTVAHLSKPEADPRKAGQTPSRPQTTPRGSSAPPA